MNHLQIYLVPVMSSGSRGGTEPLVWLYAVLVSVVCVGYARRLWRNR